MFKSKNPKTFIQKIALFSLVSIITLTIILGVFSPKTEAAQFFPKNEKQKETLQISSSDQNVYAASNKINVSESVQKDLVLLGEQINISAPVGRSVMAVANDISINTQVFGATRLAGQKIVLTGNFREEVLIAASEVVIKDSQISGDLYIIATKVTIQNSQISGNSNISYNELNGDVKSQTTGQTSLSKQENYSNNFEEFAGVFLIWVLIAQQVSNILFLLIICFWLNKKKALQSFEIIFDNNFGKDFAIGIASWILMIPFLVLSFIFQFYFLAIAIGGLITLTFGLSQAICPIYLANLFKNSLKIEMDIKLLIFLCYLGILILNFIPFINIFGGLFLFVIFSANYGFLLRKAFVTIDNSLDLISDNSQKETSKISEIS
jgi:hypothetical protein